MITQEEKAPGSSHSSFVGGTLDQHDGKDQQKTDDCAVTPTIDRLQCYNLLDLPAGMKRFYTFESTALTPLPIRDSGGDIFPSAAILLSACTRRLPPV